VSKQFANIKKCKPKTKHHYFLSFQVTLRQNLKISQMQKGWFLKFTSHIYLYDAKISNIIIIVTITLLY